MIHISGILIFEGYECRPRAPRSSKEEEAVWQTGAHSFPSPSALGSCGAISSFLYENLSALLHNRKSKNACSPCLYCAQKFVIELIKESKVLIYVLISTGLFILVYYTLKMLGWFRVADKNRKPKKMLIRLCEKSYIF